MHHTSSPLRRKVCVALLAGILPCVAQISVAADAWPSKPITLVVPFAPGGTTDIVGRAIGQKLSEALHQPVIVDNRPGAGGTIGATAVVRAAADGYTFLLATVAHTMAPGIYKTLPYDFSKELEPVGMVALTPNVLIINPSVPAKSVAELVAYIKANPGKVNYGSAGTGSTEHLSGELFRSMTGVEMTHVPYKGGAPMMVDLIGGQIQMAIETSPSAAPHVRSGKVKALAVTTPKRSTAYPGVPTMNEAGVKDFDVTTWYALMAPHGTPAATLQRMSAELAKVLAQPEMQKRFEEQGLSTGTMTAPQLGVFIKSETDKWGKVAKQAGATVQ